MDRKWRVAILAGLGAVGLAWLLADGGPTAAQAQSGLPGTTSTGRPAIGGPTWVRPSQFPPNWKELHPEWLTEPGELFANWHPRGIQMPRRQLPPPIRPGTVGPPTTTPGTPGPGVP